MKNQLTRREAMKKAALTSGALALPLIGCSTTNQPAETVSEQKIAKYKHSTCRWCYNSIPLEELCEKGKDIGLHSIELLKADEWATAKKYGLECAVGTGTFASIPNGFNDPANHAKLYTPYSELIKQAADNGIPTVIVFSGNRRDISDEDGLENCAVGLDKLVKEAEEKGVTIIMELLNSKVNHKDYMCDLTPWGAKLVDKIGSPNFKLLYDIYHMQIMEGDIIATIRKYKDYIAHYHTGGVPGRNEIDESQELFYPAIMRAIAETGYTGFVGQEFIPAGDDKIAALAQGVKICTV